MDPSPSHPLVSAQPPFDYALVEGDGYVALMGPRGQARFESVGLALASIGTLTSLTWKDAPAGTRALQVTGSDGALKTVQLLEASRCETDTPALEDPAFGLRARVRHDLANILQVAALALEVPALTLAERETQRQRLRSSLRSAQRVLDLLDTPADATHHTSLPRRPATRLTSELHHVAKALEAVAESRGVTLEVTCGADAKIDGWAASELSVFFFNLGLNAVQAGRPGDAVRLSAEAGPASIDFAVIDTGPGIPEELRDAIWKGGTTTKSQGSGIGLQAVKAATSRLGGTLTCTSSSEGTTMRLVVPRGHIECRDDGNHNLGDETSERSPERRKATATVYSSISTSAKLKRARQQTHAFQSHQGTRFGPRARSGVIRHAAKPLAWIVEDNPALCAMLSLILEAEGYEVLCAPNLEKAHAQLGTISPNVAFVDRELPHGDGITLLKALLLDRPQTHLVEMSGFDSRDHEGRWKLLRKPFDVDVLIELLPNACREIAAR